MNRLLSDPLHTLLDWERPLRTLRFYQHPQKCQRPPVPQPESPVHKLAKCPRLSLDHTAMILILCDGVRFPAAFQSTPTKSQNGMSLRSVITKVSQPFLGQSILGHWFCEKKYSVFSDVRSEFAFCHPFCRRFDPDVPLFHQLHLPKDYLAVAFAIPCTKSHIDGKERYFVVGAFFCGFRRRDPSSMS